MDPSGTTPCITRAALPAKHRQAKETPDAKGELRIYRSKITPGALPLDHAGASGPTLASHNRLPRFRLCSGFNGKTEMKPPASSAHGLQKNTPNTLCLMALLATCPPSRGLSYFLYSVTDSSGQTKHRGGWASARVSFTLALDNLLRGPFLCLNNVSNQISTLGHFPAARVIFRSKRAQVILDLMPVIRSLVFLRATCKTTLTA